jgi:long-chain acyl-CoA synthetase
MFHVAGTANVFASTWVGSRQVILPRFDPAQVVTAIEAEQVSHVVLVPTMLAMLMDHLDGHPAALGSLRHVQYAASPITPELQRRVLDRLSCEVHQFYGMTEAAPTVSQLNAEDHRRGLAGEAPFAARLRSMGAPVPGVQAEIRDGDGERLEPGEVGEVWVRGPNVMLGYWNLPEATAAAFAEDWYRSGDAAYADEDGYLYMVDRFKDIIISGGENVYSVEVEMALSEHPDVVEAAVFGVPHPRWGEAVHAVVVLVPGSSTGASELQEHCRRAIAGFKVPRSIELQAEPLPRSGAGKVLKNRLREPHWRDQQRAVG